MQVSLIARRLARYWRLERQRDGETEVPINFKGYTMPGKIRTHRDLKVYQLAFETACQIFELSKSFPTAERYLLTDQINRSSRSVCANLAEAWRKRRYEKAFISKLSDAEAEACETQVWLEFAVRFAYLDRNTGNQLYLACEDVLRMIVVMIQQPEHWLLRSGKRQIEESQEPYGEPF
jgi:four helix bundle protein